MAGLTAALLLLVLATVSATTVGLVQTRKALAREHSERRRAETNATLALTALDRMFSRFSPTTSGSSSQTSVGHDGGEALVLPAAPVLSVEAAALLQELLPLYDRLTNHYHLVVCTPRGNLTAFMQQFQTSYTVYFNRRHGRTGHLFAGRHKAPLVEGGPYLLRLTRHIHLNPVKTKERSELGSRRKPQLLRGYCWSSFPSYSGLCPGIDWLEAVQKGPLRVSRHAGRGIGGGVTTGSELPAYYQLSLWDREGESGLGSHQRDLVAFSVPKGAAGSRQSLPHADVPYGRGVDVVGRMVTFF